MPVRSDQVPASFPAVLRSDYSPGKAAGAMAASSRTSRSLSLDKLRSRAFGLRLAAGLAMALCGYAASIEAALPPGAEMAAPVPEPKAMVSLAGTDPVLTGSVGPLFSAKVFSGPNRAEKRARILPQDDALAVASAFDSIRSQMLAARPKPSPAELPDIAEYLRKAHRDDDVEMPVALASIDPSLLSAALSAIEKTISFDPIPDPQSGTLAYARAVAPPSIFDTPVSMKVSEKQFQCLAEAVYFEARGETYRGQVAVAQVVLNRVKSDLYPSTICGVVYQNQSWRNACQFSFACDGIPERVTEPAAWATAKEVSEKVLRGDVYLTEVANATHYHANYVRPVWARQMKKMTTIGLHIFYRFRGTG